MAKRKTAVEPPRIAAEQLVTVPISKLVPYERNPRIHSTAQIRQLVDSMREFGFVMPILIDFENNVIAGHGRLLAAKEAGMTEVPCILVSDLSDAQRRAYIIADNKLMENAAWDNALLADELAGINALDFPVELTGFQLDIHGVAPAPLKIDGSNPQDAEMEDTEESRAFEEKFKPKKTTDDCFTPPAVYEAVRSWAVKEYGLEGREIIRPFYPGGDYQKEEYPEGCVVIDNPPFSILSEVCRWYLDQGIDFFLFAPTLSLFATAGGLCKYLVCGVTVTYENGATVNTSFVTNLGQWKIALEPELFAAVAKADEGSLPAPRELPAYVYPDCVATSATLWKVARRGIALRIPPEDTSFTRALDAQKEDGKAAFGAAFLLSKKAAAEKAAAEKAAAEKAAATRWKLSKREKKIVEGLGHGADQTG